MIKRLVVASLLVLAPVFAMAADYVEGEHYIKLDKPVPTTVKGKIEVFEFFWYGCGHCANFEPLLHEWQKTAAEDTVLTGSPAMWNQPMALHAKAFYTAKVLKKLDVMHAKFFQLLSAKPRALMTESDIKSFFVSNGVAAEDFDKAFNSFGVNSLVKQADARARGAQIEGTPEMNVNGRYRVSARMAGSQADMLKVVDFLVAQERARLAAAQ
ncbi:Thiol:disulfide interchange protein DsbA [Sinobacterium norvegicum]|uniref:Thiol:disulfide interchange protein n=1 Tax=Sinobacterium norvegicum TaxID=1641715 RepID=A0ABN8ERQ5_9GAMM|nr:thiol:disulfide interchange protein DsbA/DsbL [Sinobacterium norvegicum]CAH0992951.1 Thiol:disulfide interchange protein DsbA [Sinobacterium norvegicum]